MFCAGCNDVDPGRIDTAVTENVGKLGNVLFDSIECSGKQMTKVVRKHLVGRYPRLLTQRFHLTSDITSAHRLTRFRKKDTACSDALGIGIIQ